MDFLVEIAEKVGGKTHLSLQSKVHESCRISLEGPNPGESITILGQNTLLACIPLGFCPILVSGKCLNVVLQDPHISARCGEGVCVWFFLLYNDAHEPLTPTKCMKER